jgi:leucine dehydrogenase
MEYVAALDHEEILIRRGTRSGVFTIVAIHSTVRGPSLGGCRMWYYGDVRAGIRDAMRLSEGMTYKSAVAGLPLGGGKGVIMLPNEQRRPDGEQRRDILMDFADTVNRMEGRYLTAEDVGISDEDVAVMSEVTSHVSGLSRERGGSGDPSPWTALGVDAAIRVSCERAFGTAEVDGRSVCIIGLGHVGAHLARGLADAGAQLVVTDVDKSKKALAEELGARWVDPAQALSEDVDVVAPCALGGQLDHRTVPQLRCKVVAGAANNQLADTSVDGLLAERGILWAPDFVANAGGIINISVELDGEYSEDRAEERVRAIGETLRRIYADVDDSGRTPLAAAMELARQRLTEARESAAV